ncbi:DUF3885 domain-containing protein [Cytobacillus purgationiresistens]|uniref:DUF3885 domain-containing protein n=1 Tax=Cytobacillus purgationiresistens TaxID=863449 RepID=A0ABU0ALX5_9BACI|nr:DUF3885 domain-containing protein [Cytobacillus purgationiresistens]MDQ0271383.1 hypothetical protein [Cytobacillus purgationiresistens]
MISVEEFLEDNFSGIRLEGSLYGQAEIGIHFELAQDFYQLNDDGTLNKEMFKVVYSEVLAIFHALFSEEDKILLVAQVYKKEGGKHKRLKVFNRRLKNWKLKYRIEASTLPDLTEEGETIQRFSLTCKKQDLRYIQIIQAACHEDFHKLTPAFGREYRYPDVFFMNVSKKLIFFIYDDRGCEVVAADGGTLLPVYENFKKLVGEYDRERIKRVLLKSRFDH